MLEMHSDVVENITTRGDSDFDIVISHTGEDISYSHDIIKVRLKKKDF
jgi:hypothetical protein